MHPLTYLRSSRLSRAVLVLLVCGACGEPRAFRLGVVMGTSGTAAAKLAVADVNAAGGIDGVPLELRVSHTEDVEARGAIEGAERLAEDPTVLAVVGHGNSGASLAASQVYNGRGLAHVSPNSTAPLLRTAGPYTFRLVPDDNRQARFLAAEGRALVGPGLRRAAILYDNDDYGRAINLELMRTLDSVGVQTVHSVAFMGKDAGWSLTNIPPMLARATPQVVFWLGRAPGLEAFLPRLRASLPDVVVIASDGVEGAEVYARPGAFAGVYFVRFIDPAQSPCIARLHVRLRETTGGGATVETALSYDAVMLLAQALRSGARDRRAIRAYLAGVGRTTPPFEGCAGPVRFDEEGDAERAYRLAVVRPGGVEPATPAGGR